MKENAKQLSKTTKFKIRQYVQFVQSILLIGAGVLAVFAAKQLDIPQTGKYVAVFAAAYAIIEGLQKLDRTVAQK